YALLQTVVRCLPEKTALQVWPRIPKTHSSGDPWFGHTENSSRLPTNAVHVSITASI
ncbi:GL17811, partial [Drosophila persimilis]